MTGDVARKTAEPSRSRRRLWALRLLTLLLAPLLVLLLLELVLRLAGSGYPSSFLLRRGEDFVSNERFGWRVFPPAIARTPCRFRVPVEKVPGTYRVLVLGESAAMGMPAPAFSFGRMLEAMLRIEQPGRRVELVNAAMTAIDSHVVRLIAEDCRRLHPDLVVVYMGNNEVVGPFGPGTAVGRFTPHRALVKLSLWVRATRTGQLLQRLLSWRQPSSGWQGMSMYLDKQVAADDPRLERAYANFQANLADICGMFRADGAKVVMATVASNLGDCPPFASRHRCAPEELQRWRERYEAGIALEKQEQFADALKQFEAAAALDGAFAELQFRMGDCFRKLQSSNAAARCYRSARDLDALRFRADSRINSIIRESAAPGILLADAERALTEDSLFYEHVHFRPHGNYLLAALVYGCLSGNPPPDEAACAARLALTDYDQCCMEADIVGLTSKPPFTNQLSHEERQARRTAHLRELTERVRAAQVETTRLVYESALQLVPDDVHLHENFARFLFGCQQFDASAEQTRWVLRWFPDDTETRTDYGRALMAGGRADDAVAQYRQALAGDPGAIEAYKGLGEVFLRTGRFREATAELEQAVKLQPDYTDARNMLGVAWLNLKEFEKAAGEFRRIIEQKPDVVAYANLASALYQQGQSVAAIEQLNIALKLADNEAMAAEIRKGIASYQNAPPQR